MGKCISRLENGTARNEELGLVGSSLLEMPAMSESDLGMSTSSHG